MYFYIVTRLSTAGGARPLGTLTDIRSFANSLSFNYREEDHEQAAYCRYGRHLRRSDRDPGPGRRRQGGRKEGGRKEEGRREEEGRRKEEGRREEVTRVVSGKKAGRSPCLFAVRDSPSGPPMTLP